MRSNDTLNRLPWDWSRCHGKGCDRRNDCLRHVALADMGPRTPMIVRYCDEIGRESSGFIAIREEAEQ